MFLRIDTERGMRMDLSSKIEKAKNMADAFANCTIGKYKEFIWEYSLKFDLREIINDDLMHNNPDALFDEYKEYFLSKKMPTKLIDTNTIFYRGRIGNEILHGSEDDYDTNFILPYYQSNIEAPPPMYADGGRFNRQGVSYLYLADKIETCLAEVHLQIGQTCSVGEFKCKKQIEIIDLTKFNEDVEMKIWLEILTQPIHSETIHLYNITRFLADVFKNINGNGIYFESVQAEGHNIVCFIPSLFRLVEYSEKIYKATKINYSYIQVEDSIRSYSCNKRNINSLNNQENKNIEKKFKYLNDWIEYQRQKDKK